MVLNAALRSWMSEDPSGALDWLQQLPDADGTRSEVASTAENLSLQSASPAVAAQIASLMQPGQQQNAALQQVLTSWLQADPNAAMAWARQQTDTQVQASIFPVIASQMAATNVQGAISFAQALTGDARVNSMNSVVVTWAGNDPAAAAAYVAQEPDGQEKTQEIGSVASAWEQNAPAVANEWLGSLPTGATKDDALQGAAAGVSQSDPAAAETLVAGIGDDQTRVVAETQIAREWINSNPGAAIAWIQSSTLPPQIKDSLLIAVRVGQNN
jgi:hypothetical protein